MALIQRLCGNYYFLYIVVDFDALTTNYQTGYQLIEHHEKNEPCPLVQKICRFPSYFIHYH